MKIVINRCYGGFGLSQKALNLYNNLANTKLLSVETIKRNDPILVEVFEKFGKESWGNHSKLAVVEIPDDFWKIKDFDGMERVEFKINSIT